MSNFCLTDKFQLPVSHPHQCKIDENTGAITKLLYFFRDLFKNTIFVEKKLAPRNEPFHHIVGNG